MTLVSGENLYPNQNPRLFIDCNECKWNNEPKKTHPKSSDSYHDKSFYFLLCIFSRN